jgi:Fe2+ or Zn2+ uptake regulation protein
LSVLQDKLLEILSKSPVQMSTKELQENVLEITNSSHRLSTVHRALLALEKFDLVELQKEKAYGGRHGYHCFWSIKSTHEP